MAKAKCGECGTVFDIPNGENADVQKLLADHTSKYHENKTEAITAALKSAKEFVFAVANGSIPTRKKAKVLLSDLSHCLSEPMPEFPEDKESDAPVTAPSDADAPAEIAPVPGSENVVADDGKTSAGSDPDKKKGKGK